MNIIAKVLTLIVKIFLTILSIYSKLFRIIKNGKIFIKLIKQRTCLIVLNYEDL